MYSVVRFAYQDFNHTDLNSNWVLTSPFKTQDSRFKIQIIFTDLLIMNQLEQWSFMVINTPIVMYSIWLTSEYTSTETSLCLLTIVMGFFLNGTEFTKFSEFRESTEAWIRVNLTVFSVSCVHGTVVESLPLTQEILGSSTIFWKKVIILSLNSLNSVKTFRENSTSVVNGDYHLFLLTDEANFLIQMHQSQTSPSYSDNHCPHFVMWFLSFSQVQ